MIPKKYLELKLTEIGERFSKEARLYKQLLKELKPILEIDIGGVILTTPSEEIIEFYGLPKSDFNTIKKRLKIKKLEKVARPNEITIQAEHKGITIRFSWYPSALGCKLIPKKEKVDVTEKIITKDDKFFIEEVTGYEVECNKPVSKLLEES